MDSLYHVDDLEELVKDMNTGNNEEVIKNNEKREEKDLFEMVVDSCKEISQPRNMDEHGNHECALCETEHPVTNITNFDFLSVEI